MARRIDNPLRLLPHDGSTEGSPVASPRELAAAPVFHHSDAGLRGFESPSRHRRGAGHTVSHDASSHGSRRGSYPGLRREGSFASDTSKLKWDRGSGSNLGTDDDDDDEDGLQDPRVDGCALSMAGTLAAAQTSLGPDHNDDEAVRFTAASHRAQFAGSGDVVFTRATMATTTFKRGITWDYGCPLMESDFLAFQNASPLPRVAFALFAMLFALIHWVSRIATRDSPFGDVDCTEAIFVVPVAWAALTLLLEGAMSLYYGRPVNPLPPAAASDAGAKLNAEDRQTSLAHAAALTRARVADVWNLLTAVVVPASFLLMDPLRQHTRCALSSTDSFLPVRPHVAPGTDRCAVAPEADLLTVVIFAFFVPLRVRWFPVVAVALVTAALLVELVDFWPAAVGAIYFRRDAGYRGFVVCVYTCEVLFALVTAFLKDREARAHFEARVINAQRAFRQRLLAERLRTFALAALPGSLPLDLDPSSAECHNCDHGHSHTQLEFTLPPLSTAVPPTFGARALPAGDTCPRGAALHCQVMHLQHLATDTFLRCASKAATPSAVDDDDPGISERLPSTGSTQQTEGNNSKPAPAVRLRLDPAEDRDSPCNASFLIVQALDLFVQSFDGLAKQFGAFRISTLGDGLWAVAGLRAPPSDNPEYALQLCRMARHLHDAVEHARHRLPGGSVLAMRAAIDVGSLAGGICVHACRAQYEASGRSCRVAAAMLRMAPSKGTVVSAAVRAEVRKHFATTEMNTLHLCGERTKMFLLGRGLVVASSHAGNALGHGGLSRSGSTVNSATTTDDEGRARVRSTGCALDTPLGSVPCTPSQGPIRAHSGPLVPPLAVSTVADPPRQPSMSSDALGEPRTAPVSHGPTSMESSRVVAVVTTDDRRQGDAARCPQEAKAAVELRGCGVLSHFADAAAEAAYVEYDLPPFKESRLATPAIHAVLALTLAVGVLVVHSGDAVLAVGLTVVAAALCGVLVLLRNTFHGHSLWRFTAYAALCFLPSVCVAVALSVLPGSPMLCAGGYILSLMLIAQFHVVKRTSSRAYCGIFVAHTAAVLLTEAGAHAWLLDTPTVWHTELFVLLEKLLFAIGFFYASTRASRAFFVDEYLTHAAMRRARQEEHKQESMLARLLPPPAAAAVISDILSWDQGQHELLAYGSRDAIVLAVHCSRSETAGYSGESSRGDSVSRLMSASAVSADSVMRSADETSASAEWTWRMNVHHAIDKALAIVSSGTVTLVGREGDTTLLIANCPPWTRDAPCEDMSGLPPLDGFAGALQRLCSISHLLSLELSEAGTTFRIGIHAAPVATAIIGTGRPTFTALGPGTSGAVALSRAAVGDNVAVVSQSTRKAGSVLCARRPFGSVLATIEVEGVGLADLFRLSPTSHRNIMPPAVRPT